MRFSVSSSWELFFINFFIYSFIQVVRIVVDYFLPKSWTDPSRKWFQVHKWEDQGRFYERHFRITSWKDRLPNINSLNNFDKTHLLSHSPEYLEAFVREINLGESHHVRSICTTLIFALWNPPGMFLLVFLLSFLIQVPFIMIHRYNRPRLLRLLGLSRARQRRLRAMNVTPVQASERASEIE